MTVPSNDVFVEVFGRTDVGRVRDHNEDTFAIADLLSGHRGLLSEIRRHRVGRHGTLLMVCDGMGGAAAGEAASQMAADTVLSEMLERGSDGSITQLARALDAALKKANARILEMARGDATRNGMGTTCSVAVILGSKLLTAQVGDSRVYVVRGGSIVQVTRDQSLLNQLLDTGQITEADIPGFEHGNVILQALGVLERVQPVMTWVDLQHQDKILLCSDGLSGLLDDQEIHSLVSDSCDLMTICKRLTTRANDKGGMDNITVIVAEVRSLGLGTLQHEIEVHKGLWELDPELEAGLSGS